MTLTDTAIRAAKPREKAYKLADGGGLYLLVNSGGGKLWRMKYRMGGKEKLLSFGAYPAVSLRDARERRDEAKRLLAGGKDPMVEKQKAALAASISAANTFEAVAEELIAKAKGEERAEATLNKKRWLLSLLRPSIGSLPISDIKPSELLAALRAVEKTGKRETANRMRAFAGAVFKYAISTDRAEDNPAANLQGALAAPKTAHRAAILDPEEFGQLLRAIDGFAGQPTTKNALILLAHLFCRPGELRAAAWSEFDLAKGLWTIPEGRMKMRRPHVVPLSTQALAILTDMKALTGRGYYVFPSVRSTKRPLSENTFNAALRRLGYDKDEVTAHGFRSTASTILNESGLWSADAIERALAHKDRDEVRGTYDRGVRLEERAKMMQWWSDYLDRLREIGAVAA